MLYEGSRDFLNTLMAYGFMGWNDFLEKAKTTGVAKYLPLFERVCAITN